MRALALLAPLLLLLAAMPGTADGAAEGVTSFYFEAPSTFTGPIVVAATFDFGEDNACKLRSVASGRSVSSPVNSWEEFNGKGGAFFSTFSAHAHANAAGLAADTREVRGRSGLWSIASTYTWGLTGVQEYALVVFESTSWSNAAGYRAPLVLDVACEKPFLVDNFRLGFEAVSLSPDSMSGGSGATANQLFGYAALVSGDRLDATFTHEEVRARAWSSTWNAHVRGELRFATPEGARAWDLKEDVPESRTRSLAFAGGPGDYAVELDYLAAGISARVLGVLYASDPVDALEL